jgi:predicted transport protein
MKICPKCGSDNVDSISFWDDSLWICKLCDYVGSVIKGDEELIKEIKENYIKLKEKEESIIANQENKSLEKDLTDDEIKKKLNELTDINFDFNHEKATEKLISDVNSDIIKIYRKLNKKILSWSNKIKVELISNYLTYSDYVKFLKISFDKDKINLQLYFNVNNPFDDYKDVTVEIENDDDEIIELKFSLNSYEDIEYALFLIKQSYENNKKPNFLKNFLDKNLPLEEDLTDNEIKKKLNELTKIDFDLNDYAKATKKLISDKNSNLVEIFNKLNKEILSWNNKIKFKPINSYLTYSHHAEFLKISLDEDKINLQLSFNVNNPFDDYKDITVEIESENDDKIIELKFSLNSYDEIEYALFLIKQSYENNKKHNFLNNFLDKYLYQNKYY